MRCFFLDFYLFIYVGTLSSYINYIYVSFFSEATGRTIAAEAAEAEGVNLEVVIGQEPEAVGKITTPPMSH